MTIIDSRSGSPNPAAAAERARLVSDIKAAGQALAQAWPIETFIAVNPLGGFEDLPFGEAIRQAGEILGARGTLGEDYFRRAHAEGRITDADLAGAIARRFPRVPAEPGMEFRGRKVEPVDLLLADLLHGPPEPPPSRLEKTVSERIAPRVAEEVDVQTSKWCGAYLDEAQARWQMPGREEGFFPAWRDLASRDRKLPAGARRALAGLPERPDDAVLAALDELGIEAAARRAILRAHLTRMPGWAAHVRWHGDHDGRISLTEYLAMRLSLEAALLEDQGAGTDYVLPEEEARPGPTPAERAARALASIADGEQATAGELEEAAFLIGMVPGNERALVWLDAYESHYRDPLIDGLSGEPAETRTGRPEAQLVCCIDVRSEGLRRHFEESGPYETLGFAGFFAVAIRYRDLAGGQPGALCPVLLEARNPIDEKPADGARTIAGRRLAGLQAMTGAEDSFHAAEGNLAGPFVLAETTGWASGPVAAAKTFFSGRFGAVRSRLHRGAAPEAPTVLTVNEGFTFEERALFAEVALTMMGLTEDFGRVVLLCGHGSTTENNPYEAALDCGACGGNRGAPNARTAAAILNGQDVREHLAGKGIEIPDDTWFAAAEHDTATDRVTLLDRHLVPQSHQADLDRLDRDLAIAGARLSAERCAVMPGAPDQLCEQEAASHVAARSTDWAQVFPEWGLAGNAAFIVGPRSITRGLDLGRRTFLHSYEARVDRDGDALETILTAPMVVAQWINCQYYFSTVDPVAFGSGTKTIHNVVGGIGVLAGHGGDLQPGLPWQSVADGERLVHEPMRLLTIVQAPLERIDSIIDRNTVLQQLFGNEWVALAARSAPGDPWMRHTSDGWEPWTDPEENR
jgi:uncharacterized protein YbcC (UPF0753/DUF2309 family)